MPTTFDVERFEHVAATAETTLLRLSGRWHAEQRERLSPPMLVVDDGSKTQRLPALPRPAGAAPPPRPPARPRGRRAPRRPRGPTLARRLLGARRAGRHHAHGLRARRRQGRD